MSKQKLERAAALIKQKDYEGARRILVTIKKDPTAQKWLARIEELAPRPKKKRPWWATGIGAGVVVFGVLIVCSLIGQALNIIPIAEESGATRTVVAAMTDDANRGTQVAINTGMTQTVAREATNIALTPSATATITDTPAPRPTETLTFPQIKETSEVLSATLQRDLANYPDIQEVSVVTVLEAYGGGMAVVIDVVGPENLNSETAARQLMELAGKSIPYIVEFELYIDHDLTNSSWWIFRDGEWTNGLIRDGEIVDSDDSVSVASGLTPDAMPVFDRVTYIQQLTDGLFILAGGRDIASVDVADGRAQGGERVIIISYRTNESNQQGYEDEWIDIFRAVAATIKAQELDVDSVTLIVGRADNSTAGTMVAQVEDLMDLLEGRIPREVFFERLSVTTF